VGLQAVGLPSRVDTAGLEPAETAMRPLGIEAAQQPGMTITIEAHLLDTVTGAGRATGNAKNAPSLASELSTAWTNTKNFGGGLLGGALHGANAKTSQIETYADTSSRATKAGFEMGAAGNMGAGPIGDLVGLGADLVNPAR
jgi:hypothetical protein